MHSIITHTNTHTYKTMSVQKLLPNIEINKTTINLHNFN